MARTGRPKTDNPRNKFLTVRFTEEEYARLQRLAAYQGISISNYVKRVLGNVNEFDTAEEGDIDVRGEKRQ